MKRFARILIGLALLAAGVGASALLWVTRPKAQEKSKEQVAPTVEVLPVTYQARKFEIPSQGIIEASRRSQLASEVGGKVIDTFPNFEAGLFVKEGEALLQIDPVDFEAALAQAKASEAEALAAVASEEARAAQAEADWNKFGGSKQPKDLALRGPQLRSAKQRAIAATAAVAKAAKDLDRTTITAPYDAVIASTSTEKGNFLAPGTPVAEIFETGNYEVRLPLSIDEMQFLKTNGTGKPTGKVTIEATVGGSTETWTGEIIRTEGEVDRSTRSIYIVASINPISDNEAARLQPGQFVEAFIPGREIPNIAAIPANAFLDLNRVTVVDPDNKLQFREVSVVFREGNTVYISGGVKEGENLNLTELSRMVRGTVVKPVPAEIAEKDPSPANPQTAL